MSNLEKTVAQIWVDVTVDCPYCGYNIELTDDSVAHNVEKSDIMIAAFQDEWGCKNADIEVNCPNCDKQFIVDEIEY